MINTKDFIITNFAPDAYYPFLISSQENTAFIKGKNAVPMAYAKAMSSGLMMKRLCGIQIALTEVFPMASTGHLH